jgi:hypothetical protein
MIEVVISFPGGVRREVVLAGVPRVGEHIRLSDIAPTDPPLLVEYVLWCEGSNGASSAPMVILVVKPHPGSAPLS